jgi:hypothetical protein
MEAQATVSPTKHTIKMGNTNHVLHRNAKWMAANVEWLRKQAEVVNVESESPETLPEME